MELGMEEIRIPENSKLVGMELMASGLRSNYDLIVMAIKRAERTMVFNPPPQEVFHDGDILVVIGAVGNLSRFGQDLYGCDYPTMHPCIS
jgi:voltage-gated potassium channel